jgi:hypothetical protein
MKILALLASFFYESIKRHMKNYILPALLFASILGFSCSNPNDTSSKTVDSVVSGNTDSAGSQPVQPIPAAANEGNATDTIVPLRTDSVIKH